MYKLQIQHKHKYTQQQTYTNNNFKLHPRAWWHLGAHNQSQTKHWQRPNTPQTLLIIIRKSGGPVETCSGGWPLTLRIGVQQRQISKIGWYPPTFHFIILKLDLLVLKKESTEQVFNFKSVFVFVFWMIQFWPRSRIGIGGAAAGDKSGDHPGFSYWVQHRYLQSLMPRPVLLYVLCSILSFVCYEGGIVMCFGLSTSVHLRIVKSCAKS